MLSKFKFLQLLHFKLLKISKLKRLIKKFKENFLVFFSKQEHFEIISVCKLLFNITFIKGISKQTGQRKVFNSVFKFGNVFKSILIFK